VGVLIPRRQLTDRASDTSVASPSSAGDHRSAFATPFEALALASVIAFPREEAAKVAVTTAS